ncbi:MAG TPA: hypothetical protein VMK12_10265 [Anaeromyxobacteraceae bacterium]|nr:hypothetical protein [Anaeromyxobacteraceae bacterium]
MRHLPAALALIFSGCLYEPPLPHPPPEPRERARAEIDACWRGVLPAWIDESALVGAARLDRREAQASTANESFHGATFTAQPPASPSGPHVTAILGERRAFEEQCALMRGKRTREH